MSQRKTAEEKEKEKQEKAADDKKKEEQVKAAEKEKEKEKEQQRIAAEKKKEQESKITEETKAAGPEMVRVRVKKEIVKNNGGFHDFHSGVDMYPKSHQKIFTVPITPFITQKLRTGELILVAKKT